MNRAVLIDADAGPNSADWMVRGIALSLNAWLLM